MKRTEQFTEEELYIGKYLEEDVFDRNGIFLLKKGSHIGSEKQLVFLQQRRAGYRVEFQSEETIRRPSPKNELTPFDLIDDVYTQLSNLCHPKTLKLVFPSRIITLAKKIQTAAHQNLDATLGALLLGDNPSYSIIHQIHCALICELIARQLDYPSESRLKLMASALTMNIAMLELQDTLINQKEKLNPEIKEEVYNHPQRGVDLLRSYGVTDETWLKSVYHHHEFLDGSGYPKGLEGQDIDSNAQILTLVDVYCVKLFSRAYRLPLPPDVAAREIITGSRGQCFDQNLARILVKEIGIFHPGSLVRLINGEVAVVTGRGKKIHHPIVQSVLKENGLPYSKPIRRDCSRENYSIIYSIAPQHLCIDINPKRLWGY